MINSFINFIQQFSTVTGKAGGLAFIAVITFVLGFFFALFRFIKSFNIFT